MRTYIKKFENESEYAAFVNSSGFVTPNVSAWEIESGETEVNFNKTKPDIEVPREYVDLGLPSGTLWATTNIQDADGNELYFAWGETQGYTQGQVGTAKNFTWADYEFGTSDNLTKYNSTDGKTVLDSEDDAATANWGSSWRMPTKEQFEELIANTEYEWTTVNGVQGIKFTSTVNGYTDKFLFFPAIGGAENGEVYDVGDYGYYRSVSLNDKNISSAWNLYFRDGDCDMGNDGRYCGYSVRPVKAQD